MKYLKTYELFESFKNDLIIGDLYQYQLKDDHSFVYLGDSGDDVFPYVMYDTLSVGNPFGEWVYDLELLSDKKTIEEYLKENSKDIDIVIKIVIDDFNNESLYNELSQKSIECIKKMRDRLNNDEDIKKYIELDQLGIL